MVILENKCLVKTIGIILGSFEESCQSSILAGIEDFAKNNNIHLITFVGVTLDEEAHYSSSYNMIGNLVEHAQIDALICMGGAMANLLSKEEIANFIKRFSGIPLVNISGTLPSCVNIVINNEDGIYQIVSHLIVTHHCKRIAFVSGPKNHEEAEARLMGYKNALIAHNIPIVDELILSGSFSLQSGKDAVKHLIDEKKTAVDAFVCADDLIACGVLNALNSRNILVPKDISVTGFDDLPDSSSTLPPLTTVAQPFYELGHKAMEAIHTLISGQAVPPTIYLSTTNIIRESCGCFLSHVNNKDPLPPLTPPSSLPIDTPPEMLLEKVLGLLCENVKPLAKITLQEELYTLANTLLNDTAFDTPEFWGKVRKTIYITLEFGVPVKKWNEILPFFNLYYDHCCSDKNIYKSKYLFHTFSTIIDEIYNTTYRNSSKTDSNYFFRLRYVGQKLIASFDMQSVLNIVEDGLRELSIEECYIVLTKTNCILAPDYVQLAFAYKNNLRLSSLENLLFKASDFLPSQIFLRSVSNAYLVMPLIFRDEHFGYVVFKHNNIESSIFESLRSHISSGIKGSLIYAERCQAEQTARHALKQLKIANLELKHLSIKDEMTNLYNRRGFMEIANSYFSSAQKIKQAFVIYFLDLDNLKTINDTYGHAEGDSAIIAMSKILQESFTPTDFLARLGGDEFIILAVNSTINDVPTVFKNIHLNFDIYNEYCGKPYLFSTSIGYSCYDGTFIGSLQDLIDLADMSLYKQKIKKKCCDYINYSL